MSIKSRVLRIRSSSIKEPVSTSLSSSEEINSGVRGSRDMAERFSVHQFLHFRKLSEQKRDIAEWNMHGFRGKAPAHVVEHFDDLISDQKRDFDRWKFTATRDERPAILDRMKKRSLVMEAIYDGGTLRGRQISLSTGKEHFGPEQARAQFPSYFLAEHATQEALQREERQAREEQERNEALRQRAARVEEDYRAKKRARELVETEPSSLSAVAVNEEGEPDSEDVIGARKRRSVSRSRSVSRARPSVTSETSSLSSEPPSEPVFPFTSPSQPYRDPPTPPHPVPDDPAPEATSAVEDVSSTVTKKKKSGREHKNVERRGRSVTRAKKVKRVTKSTTREVVEKPSVPRIDPMAPPVALPLNEVEEIQSSDIPPPTMLPPPETTEPVGATVRRSLSPSDLRDFPVFDLTALPPAESVLTQRRTEDPPRHTGTGIPAYPSLSAEPEDHQTGEDSGMKEIEGGVDANSMSINVFSPVVDITQQRTQSLNSSPESVPVPSMPRRSAAMLDAAQEKTSTRNPLTSILHTAHSTAIRYQRPEHEMRNIDFYFNNVKYGPQPDNIGFYKDFVKHISRGTGAYGQREGRVVSVKGFEVFIQASLPERVLHEKEDRWADDSFRFIFGFQRKVLPSFSIKDVLAIHSTYHNMLSFPNMRGLGSSFIILADEMIVCEYRLLHEFTKAGAEKESTFMSRTFYAEASSQFNWRILFDDSDRENPKTIEGDLFFAVISEKGFHFRFGEHLAESRDMVTANIDLDIRLIYE